MHNKSVSVFKALFLVFLAAAFSFTLAVFVIPLIKLCISAFAQKPTTGFNSRIFSIAAFTITQAFLSALAATVIGTMLAYFCAEKKIRSKRFLLSLAAIPVSVPPLIIALAYIFFFGKQGVFNSILYLISGRRLNSEYIYTLFFVVLVHSFYNFPICLKTVTGAWENTDVKLEQAASLLTESKFVIFTKIILPQIYHAIISSFLIIFLYCFFSFLIILLFGGLGRTTLEVEMYQISRTTGNITDAAYIALIETIIAALATCIYVFSKLHVQKNPIETQTAKQIKQLNKREKIIFNVLFSLVILFLILPLVSIFLKSVFNFNISNRDKTFGTKLQSLFALNMDKWISMLQSKKNLIALFNTIIVGIITASVSVLTAIYVHYLEFCLLLKSKESLPLKILPYIPLTISPIILGYALQSFFITTSSMPIILLSFAQATTAWTIAYTQINGYFTKIPHSLLFSGSLLAANNADTFIRVCMPQMKGGIKSAFAFCFAISAGDATLPLILKMPNFENISLLIFRLAGSYRFTESAICATLLIILVCAVFLLCDHRSDKIYQT